MLRIVAEDCPQSGASRRPFQRCDDRIAQRSKSEARVVGDPAVSIFESQLDVRVLVESVCLPGEIEHIIGIEPVESPWIHQRTHEGDPICLARAPQLQSIMSVADQCAGVGRLMAALGVLRLARQLQEAVDDLGRGDGLLWQVRIGLWCRSPTGRLPNLPEGARHFAIEVRIRAGPERIELVLLQFGDEAVEQQRQEVDLPCLDRPEWRRFPLACDLQRAWAAEQHRFQACDEISVRGLEQIVDDHMTALRVAHPISLRARCA